jgi:phage repressor protein C with HTH and peptisase S24 domain
MLRKAMPEENARTALDALIRERGEDYSSLSRMLGRNAAYIQQFIKRGVPRKLDEEDRATLARYFGVPEERLGGPRPVAQTGSDLPRRIAGSMVLVPKLDLGASAGHGAFAAVERAHAHIAFDARWLREVADGPAAKLSLIRVQGDSMAPTLMDGDEILVDSGDGGDRLRDGIYVLRVEDVLLVKRLALKAAGRRLTIRSDNPQYPDVEDCDLASVTIIGRVVWAGRRFA